MRMNECSSWHLIAFVVAFGVFACAKSDFYRYQAGGDGDVDADGDVDSDADSDADSDSDGDTDSDTCTVSTS